jgi:hypothetical protein
MKVEPPPHPATIVEAVNAKMKRLQRESRKRTISPPQGNDPYSKALLGF